MTWLILVAMAAAAFLGLCRFGRLDGAGLQLVAAALFLALAGYAWQGNPDLAGSPRAAAERPAAPRTAFMELRRDMFGQFDAADRWLIISESFAGRGETGQAAAAVHSALRARPNNPVLWVGYGDALALHGNGVLSPAADYAFRKGISLAPRHPGPLIFYGIALAQHGRFDEAERAWRNALALSPAEAPWREGLLAQIEQIRSARAAGAARP